MTRNAPRLLVLSGVLVSVATASAGTISPHSTAGQSAKKSLHCTSTAVKRKLTFVQGKRKRTVTACVPRTSLKQPASIPAGLVQSRRVAVLLAPRAIGRLLRQRAARRVSSADALGDRALAASFRPVASASARGGARAATVTTFADTQVLRGGPPGTVTVQHRSGTSWDKSEPNPGEDLNISIQTTATRLDGLGAAKKQDLKLLRTMARCPDAGGIGNGVIKYSNKENRTIDVPGGGRAAIETTTSFDARVLVHFDDEAHVTSTEVVGEWAWSTVSRSSGQSTRHAVGGSVTSSSSGPNGSGVVLGTSVSTASSPSAAVWGILFGALATLIPQDVVGELVSDIAERASSGACAKIVLDPLTVRVRAGGTVTVGATLNDSDGGPLTGKLKAAAGKATVAPAEIEAGPTGSFTYAALAISPPDRTDTVTFSHVSRRGRANPKTVTVIYEQPLFPDRFAGTWTRVLTAHGDSGNPGWVETVRGSATFVRNPLFGHELDGVAQIPYEIESASVDWTVSGSGSPYAGCTLTYSGSGRDDWTSAWGATRLTLEDIRNQPGAQNPEPRPYNYSIRADGDSGNPQMFTISYSAGCNATDHQEPIIENYLKIGSPGYDPGNPAEDVEQSNDPRLLEGHRARDNPSFVATDDTWRFTGLG